VGAYVPQNKVIGIRRVNVRFRHLRRTFILRQLEEALGEDYGKRPVEYASKARYCLSRASFAKDFRVD